MKQEKLSDCWQTPDWLFKELNKEFNFDVDLCASEANAKCVNWYDDYLSIPGKELSPIGATCFMNPPYSNPKPFIEKAWEDSKHCKIVCLVKCDPSTKWWATFWDYDIECPFCMLHDDCPTNDEWNKMMNCTKCNEFHTYNGPKPGCDVRFFPKRIKFDPPASLNLTVVGNKYKIGCDDFDSIGSSKNSFLDKSPCTKDTCLRCKGTGFRWANLAGASFPCALVIFDRRGL